MRLNNLTIGTRLNIGFGLVLLLACLIGLVGAVQLHRLKLDFDDEASNVVPSLEKISDMQVSLAAMRRWELRYSTETTVEGKAKTGQLFADARAAFDKAHNEYASLVADDEDGRLWRAIQANVEAYEVTFEELKRISLPGEDMALVKPGLSHVQGVGFEAFSKCAAGRGTSELEVQHPAVGQIRGTWARHLPRRFGLDRRAHGCSGDAGFTGFLHHIALGDRPDQGGNACQRKDGGGAFRQRLGHRTRR